MLVVVHHGDVESLLQTFLDIEALWRLDVLKVDATECRRNLLYSLAELLGVFLVNLYVEYVDASVNLEEQALALHNRLTAHSADVTQS